MSRHLFVSGRVQGVYFRESMRAEAERVGVSGWVRNLPDGRVEALVDGPDAAVEAMLRWVARGPEQAHVERVAATTAPPISQSRFRVLR